ncbi:MAG: hypothetical protein HRT74_07380 [Flavobacteriales bacterium]|nr:hypothetical protein [Flavobacteriales bacterium]
MINKVTWAESNGNVTFECKENQLIVPILSFGAVDDHHYFLGGLVDSNVGGRGHKVIAYAQYDRMFSYSLLSRWNRIKQSNWGLEASVVRWSTVEPAYIGDLTVDYNYSNESYGISAIRHYDWQSEIHFGGNYFVESYQSRSFQTEVPNSLTTRKWQGKIFWRHARLNYESFYVEGWGHDLWLQSVVSLDGDPRFDIAFSQLTYFKRVGGRGNWANRFKMGWSTNTPSPFAPFVLDSYLNIRGAGNRVDRGTGTVVFNSEYRHTLFDFGKIAAQGVGFVDAGTWRQPGAELNEMLDSENMIFFTGLGLRLIAPRINGAVLQIDYAVSPTRMGDIGNGFVIGLGQFF